MVCCLHFLADEPFPVYRSVLMTDPIQTTKSEKDKLKTEDDLPGNFVRSFFPVIFIEKKINF